jgi:hypothetical protein
VTWRIIGLALVFAACSAGWPIGIGIILGLYLGLKSKKRAKIRKKAAKETERLLKAANEEVARLKSAGLI